MPTPCLEFTPPAALAVSPPFRTMILRATGTLRGTFEADMTEIQYRTHTEQLPSALCPRQSLGARPRIHQGDYTVICREQAIAGQDEPGGSGQAQFAGERGELLL